jgi:hypothetical protein
MVGQHVAVPKRNALGEKRLPFVAISAVIADAGMPMRERNSIHRGGKNAWMCASPKAPSRSALGSYGGPADMSRMTSASIIWASWKNLLTASGGVKSGP